MSKTKSFFNIFNSGHEIGFTDNNKSFYDGVLCPKFGHQKFKKYALNTEFVNALGIFRERKKNHHS